MEELELKTDKFQRDYKADEKKADHADQDKDVAHIKRTNEEMARKLTDQMNREIMDMVKNNPTFERFIHQYLKVMFDWGVDNHLEWWEVGVDGSQSWFAHDGKTIMFKPCRTERNANPLTGERKTQGGIILPRGL